jgi:hypothetical protein
MRGSYSSSSSAGILICLAVVLCFCAVVTLADQVHLDIATTGAVLGRLGLAWLLGYCLGRGLLGVGLSYSWPGCLGLSWIALMPAFSVWLDEDTYAWLEPFWSQWVGVFAVALLAFRIRSIAE